VQPKIWVGASEDGDKVIFKCLDCSFGRIVSMYVGWHQLIVYLCISEKLSEDSSCVIVKLLKRWAEASTGGDKEGMDAFVGGNDLLFSSIFYWFGQNCITIVVVDHQEVVVATG
jgi:hypothetical protein